MSLMVQKTIYAMDFNPDSYKPSSTTTASGADKVAAIANSIIGPLRIVGNVVSVISLIVIGIKYMIGSVEEKAEYKQTMLPYLIGALMLFAITNLLSILATIVGGL